MEDVRPESGARRGSGSHRRGSCDLANRSSESEPSKTSPALLPRREVQACQQRQVPLQKCLQRARMEMQATIRGCRRGLFYIRIESTAETILTDFFSSLSFFFFFEAGSLGAAVCLHRHQTFGSGAVCRPVPLHAHRFYHSLVIDTLYICIVML